MTWDERQRAMLAEMGLRVPKRAEAAAEPEPSANAAPAPAPVIRPAPVASSFDALAWPELREAAAGCRACGLCETRRQVVFGEGAAAPTWLLVTDPPDEADDASGQPLGGDAGRLLDRMLAAVQLSRSGAAPRVFVTPLLKCRPPRGRAPSAAEMDACERLLARQAALLRPQLVLALGPLAARRLSGIAEPLGKLRGRVHSWGGLPLVVTYHPAYLLRTPADKAGAWDDLCLARTSPISPP